ncbi:ATP-dependent helicase HepA [Planctomycetales bacterium 10988]|nr:ATP-dependent helicase HepA [Planctomycetales bacterium 10988]
MDDAHSHPAVPSDPQSSKEVEEAGKDTQELSEEIPKSAELFATGMTSALERDPKFDLVSIPVQQERPRAVKLPLGHPKFKTFSLAFIPDEGKSAPPEEEASDEKEAENAEVQEEEELKEEYERPEQYTRIKPPQDIVKLEDRLYYVLQPPLETWARDLKVEFPFKPFPYQFAGIAFLYARYAALLADEMGLGKTMQTISTIRLLLRSREVRSVLLICPKPLLKNWEREFQLWAPEIPITILGGDSAKREYQWNVVDVPVKIANYELIMRDRDYVLDPDRTFDLVVLDEAQRIKNTSNSTAKVIRAIKRKRSWALSGTPVENRPDDLVGIFEYLSPGYITPSMKSAKLAELTSDYVLRRTKPEVLDDMPPKMFRDMEIDLGPTQREVYDLAEDKGVLKLNDLGHELTIQHVFVLVTRLKQICNFEPVTKESSKLDQLEAELEEVAASGQQMLVFSQWVDSLDIIEERLKRFNPLPYHGRIPHKKRNDIIDRFKHDKRHKVLLMSYGAGGVGLNLQFATYVFLFDRWWNPAIEDQAINRAHRIGAAGPVTVTRFISANTIEQRIDEILTEKREMFDTIFSDQPSPSSMGLCQEELFGLFDIRGPQGKIDVAA